MDGDGIGQPQNIVPGHQLGDEQGVLRALRYAV